MPRRGSRRSTPSAITCSAKARSTPESTPSSASSPRPSRSSSLRERLFRLPLERYRPLGDPTRHLDALLTFVSRAKDEDVSPAAYRAWAEGLVASAETPEAKDEAAKQMELAAFYESCQILLAEAGSRRLRRPDLPHPGAPPREPVAPGQAPRPLPLHPRRRVPGHEPRAARDGAPPGRRRVPEHHRRGRRRPGHLPLARGRRRQPPRVPDGLSRLPRGGAEREPPLDAADPGRRVSSHLVQQPVPARGRGRHRQAPARAAPRRPRRSPHSFRHRARPRPTASRP